MSFTPNNPYIPGDPYSYDLKWIVALIKKYGIDIASLKNNQITEENIYMIAQKIIGSRQLNLVNVKEYGASGNGVTDDYDAITKACAAAAELKATLYFPDGEYLISKELVIENPINISMDGYIKYNGSKTAVTVGKSGVSYNDVIQNWKIIGLGAYTAGSIGLEIKNANSSLFYIDIVNKFETGVKCNGDGAGIQNNTFIIGTIGNFVNGLVLYSENAGWSNENIFIKGRFYNPAHEWTSKAIVIDSAIETRTANNNSFYAPNLEGNDFGLYIKHAYYNHFYDCRMESVTTPIYFGDNLSQNNTIEIGYGSAGGVATARNIIKPSRTPDKLMGNANYVVRIDDIAKNAACNSSTGSIKDLYRQSSSGPVTGGAALIFTQQDDCIIMPGARTLGAHIELYNNDVKDGFISWNIKTGQGAIPAPLITFYDDGGNVITDPAENIRFAEKSFSLTTNYGHNSYVASTNSTLGYIAIPARAKSAFVGFATSGATAIKGLEILSTIPMMLKTHNVFLSAAPTSSGIIDGQLCYDIAGGFWIWNGSEWVHS